MLRMSRQVLVTASVIVAATTLAAVRGATAQVDVPPDVRRSATELPDTLPSPAAVIERHIEVTGGLEAHRRIQSRRILGTVTGSNTDGPIRLEINRVVPNGQHVRAGGQTYVVNADESWTYDDDIVVASSGDQRRQEIRRAAFHPLLDWEATYPLARTVGVELVDGRPAYVLRLATEDCDQVEMYFDEATGRHIRTVEDIAYAGDTLRSETTILTYETIDGVDVPTSTRRVIIYQGQRIVQQYAFTRIEQNVEMPDGLFETPFELRDENSTE